MIVRQVKYTEYSDEETVTLFHTDINRPFLSNEYSVLKRKSKSKWSSFDSTSTGKLFEILSGLIKKLTDDVSPNEEMAIKTLGDWTIRVLNDRLKVSEETKTRRNKLVRYLRKEIEELRK